MFARLDESDLNEVDLNAGIRSTVNIIQGHAGVKVADSYGETWPLVALREIEKLPRYVV